MEREVSAWDKYHWPQKLGAIVAANTVCPHRVGRRAPPGNETGNGTRLGLCEW